MKIIQGKVFVLGKNIDTDQIYPGRFLELVDPNEIAAHCLEGVDPRLTQCINPGDIIVAGTNFGCGSSRDHAAITLFHAQIGAVVAESFARIFYRNAINLGLNVLVCPRITKKVKEGHIVEVDLMRGLVTNTTTGEVIQGEKLSDYALEILASGGIKPLFKKKYSS
jgi:3-isopropylmalate/(R)-2-methylmalate dehydratase small subunit